LGGSLNFRIYRLLLAQLGSLWGRGKLQSLEHYQTTNLDFADCYLTAKAKVENYTGIKTFDNQILVNL
jgi:hypothetical protein